MHAQVFDAVQRQRATARQLAPDAAQAARLADPWLGERPTLPVERVSQVHLEPGDIVLVHQKTPHRIGLNRSPHIRYQTYFRLSQATHDPMAEPSDVWEGWKGRDE